MRNGSTETPEVSTTPAADDSTADSDPADSKADNKDDAPEVTETPDATEIPEITETPEDNKDNIFDRKDDAEDKRPQNAATDLTDAEKAATAVQNHTCDGITVSGMTFRGMCSSVFPEVMTTSLPMKRMLRSLNPMNLNSGILRKIQNMRFQMENTSV